MVANIKKGFMNLKNYTSTVPIINSIAHIEEYLISVGATAISKTYENGMPTGVIFQVPSNGQFLTFSLPCKADKVLDFFLKERERNKTNRTPTLTSSMKENIRAQANRTSWKLLSDWIEIQVSLIKLEQVETVEIFLPYLWDGTQTLFEKAKSDGYKFLTEHKE
jgi:hypothetical protein